MTPVDLNQVITPTTTYEECGDATSVLSSIEYDACTDDSDSGGGDAGGGGGDTPPDTTPFSIEITPT